MESRPTYEELEARVRELERGQRSGLSSPHADPGPSYELLVETIPCALYGYVRWSDGRSRFVYISRQCEDIFGHTAEEAIEDPGLLWGMVHPGDLERLQAEDASANRAGRPFQSEVRVLTPTGIKWIQLSSMPSPQRYEGEVLWSGVILDITGRKRAEEEKNQLVLELRAALDKIRKLEGIIPICSFCKKIRDDEGGWEPVDVYIRRHSETDFSHGICPDCAREHYPGV